MSAFFKKYRLPIFGVAALILLLIAGLALRACVPNYGEVAGPMLVCIDPGHGFTDTGAISPDGTRYEKDDVLRLALAVQSLLEQRGVAVIMTREDDTVYPTLEERCDIANDAEATHFVSLHRNSGGGRGIEVWVPSDPLRVEEEMAEAIRAALVEAGVQHDRGVKSGTASDPDSDYLVNRGTDMPSCLVEVGFIDNDLDNEMFDTHFADYAAAIADAIASLA